MIVPETIDLESQTTITSALKLHKKMICYSNLISFLFIKWILYIPPMFMIYLYFQKTSFETFANVLSIMYVCNLIYIITCIRGIFKIMTGRLFEWSTYRPCCVCNESLTKYNERMKNIISVENCEDITNEISYKINKFKHSLIMLCIIEIQWWSTIIVILLVFQKSI
jgi:hypothetical protein